MTSQINAVKNEKVENLNQIFTEVQRDVKSVSKSVAPEAKKQTQVQVLSYGQAIHHLNSLDLIRNNSILSFQVVREPPKESVNVDNAAQLFSQL